MFFDFFGYFNQEQLNYFRYKFWHFIISISLTTFGTNNGTVSNCYVEGDTRKASNNILTGAIGGTNAGIVKNCYSDVYVKGKYSLQGTTQGRYLTGGVPPVRFSM